MCEGSAEPEISAEAKNKCKEYYNEMTLASSWFWKRNCCFLKGRCSVKWTRWKATWQVVYLWPITALIDSKEIFSLIGEFICNLSIRARLYTWKFLGASDLPNDTSMFHARYPVHFSFSTGRNDKLWISSAAGQCRSHALWYRLRSASAPLGSSLLLCSSLPGCCPAAARLLGSLLSCHRCSVEISFITQTHTGNNQRRASQHTIEFLHISSMPESAAKFHICCRCFFTASYRLHSIPSPFMRLYPTQSVSCQWLATVQISQSWTH